MDVFLHINGEKLVGGFHTHPKSNSDPSIGDLENAYREGFESSEVL